MIHTCGYSWNILDGWLGGVEDLVTRRGEIGGGEKVACEVLGVVGHEGGWERGLVGVDKGRITRGLVGVELVPSVEDSLKMYRLGGVLSQSGGQGTSSLHW